MLIKSKTNQIWVFGYNYRFFIIETPKIFNRFKNSKLIRIQKTFQAQI
jgi:hypothetical protein